MDTFSRSSDKKHVVTVREKTKRFQRRSVGSTHANVHVSRCSERQGAQSAARKSCWPYRTAMLSSPSKRRFAETQSRSVFLFIPRGRFFLIKRARELGSRCLCLTAMVDTTENKQTGRKCILRSPRPPLAGYHFVVASSRRPSTSADVVLTPRHTCRPGLS